MNKKLIIGLIVVIVLIIAVAYFMMQKNDIWAGHWMGTYGPTDYADLTPLGSSYTLVTVNGQVAFTINGNTINAFGVVGTNNGAGKITWTNGNVWTRQ